MQQKNSYQKQMEIIDMEKYKTKIKTSWDFNH